MLACLLTEQWAASVDYGGCFSRRRWAAAHTARSRAVRYKLAGIADFCPKIKWPFCQWPTEAVFYCWEPLLFCPNPTEEVNPELKPNRIEHVTCAKKTLDLNCRRPYKQTKKCMWLFRKYLIQILALLAFFWLFSLRLMIMLRTSGSLSKKKYERVPLALNAIWKKFCVLQKKVLSFGPNRTVEVRPNSSAEPNVQSVTSLNAKLEIQILMGL